MFENFQWDSAWLLSIKNSNEIPLVWFFLKNFNKIPLAWVFFLKNPMWFPLLAFLLENLNKIPLGCFLIFFPLLDFFLKISNEIPLACVFFLKNPMWFLLLENSMGFPLFAYFLKIRRKRKKLNKILIISYDLLLIKLILPV